MSIKVLVADDSITIQKVIGIIFGGDEYSLTIVDNGTAAVDKAREINPDILLIDALMPGMTGYEVSELVRSMPSLAAKPILILTGSFEPFDEEKAKKCGADDFIAKPFESQHIITKVKELLELGRVRAQSAQASQLQPAPELLREQPPVASAPIFDIPAPVVVQQPEAPQQAHPTDIWGAFTTEIEPTVAATETSVATAHSAVSFEPDVFAIVTEENDAQLIQAAAPMDTPSHHTGSQWVPVEESTFEFEEEAPLPATAFTEQTVPFQEASFSDISFEDDIVPPAAPVFSAVPEPDFTDSTLSDAYFTVPAPVVEEPPAAEPTPVVAKITSTEIPAPVSLTEEQLTAAITGASKEVIERIVWQVVPDLAEAMIREAIRKIKEGV